MSGLMINRGNNMRSFFDPFKEMDLFNKTFGTEDFEALKNMKTDIHEKEKEYIVEVELPGFNKENIKVDIANDILTISAERKELKDEKDEKGNCIYCERSYGSFSRSFNVKDVDTKSVSAEYTNGLLHIRLPKKNEEVSQKKQIEIK